MRQIILDTETTGLYPDRGDRIVEIGCIELVNRRLTGNNLHVYLNPERASAPEALRVHGLTEEFLADKPLFADVAQELQAYLTGAQIIIHNAAFDVGFLNAELKRVRALRVDELVSGVIDTLQMAREQYPGKSNSLDALCRRLEVDNTNRSLHGALLDAGLLAEVFIRMTRGQESLVVDAASAKSNAVLIDAGPAMDLSQFDMPVLFASSEELLAHDALLADLDKASGGRAIWRTLVSQ